MMNLETRNLFVSFHGFLASKLIPKMRRGLRAAPDLFPFATRFSVRHVEYGTGVALGEGYLHSYFHRVSRHGGGLSDRDWTGARRHHVGQGRHLRRRPCGHAVLFLDACLSSYWALRTRSVKRMHRVERFADIAFIVALVFMAVVGGFVTYAIAVAK